MLIDTNFVQKWNTSLSIVVNVDGRVTDVKVVLQFEKAPCKSEVVPSGTVIAVAPPWQPAPAPIADLRPLMANAPRGSLELVASTFARGCSAKSTAKQANADNAFIFFFLFREM